MERMWKEAIMPYLEVLSQHLPKSNEESHADIHIHTHTHTHTHR
jgi:hypothetical protein